jgi:hypothetical protein
MPFDPTPLHRIGDRVTVLPPTPPERGGSPRRPVHIVVEVRLPAPPRHRPRAALWWWAVALAMIALAAHAQPVEWRSYPFGSGVNSTGTDAQGREWTARSFPVGGTTYTTITGPDGRQRRCESYVLGSETITRCDP